MTVSTSAFPRCQFSEVFGPPPGRYVQCRLPDPHPASDHDFGIDWPTYGRDLDQAEKPWLAGKLRDVTARVRYLERRETDLTAIAVQFAQLASGLIDPADVPETTRAWLRKHSPSIALAFQHPEQAAALRRPGS